ncbi:tRNA lysidine(34) synthetase TilS [Shewanella gaetbuli]|uniref:tRNA(Ile)-lysidine synthase n=1 Tax=Shewanella gaetbuli TaxID=220752 RepID=A0A9X1ZPT2_9GAMM|nr:tRNA lysidine(34) synthetase TilS [Shewanella gaetbuli]MCL1143350.1 tRNA lysidine(34) synthetase TilS [Shewanella gaetbuli]
MDIAYLVDKIAQLIERAHKTDSEPYSSTNKRKIVLAYSGGVDSEVLAYGLSEFAKLHPQFEYLLVHVHHGLSQYADDWVKHCQNRADSYQLPLQIEYVTLVQQSRQSLEAVARQARYQAIESHLNQHDILLTAHHQDDQLETLLLALKRGQGPKGLASMGEVQLSGKPEQQYFKLRPLLSIDRQQIEQFAAANSLQHIEDDSNQDDRFDRNFLRLNVIPLLKDRWPSITQTANRSANLIAQQQQMIDEEVQHKLPLLIDRPQDPLSMQANGVGLSIALLSKYTTAWQTELLRSYIDSLGLVMPSQVQLAQVLTQALTAQDDANVHIEYSGTVIKRFNQHLYGLPAATLSQDESHENDLNQAVIDWFSHSSHVLELTAYQRHFTINKTHSGHRLVFPQANQSVSLRFDQPGKVKCYPQFHLNARHKPRELKKLWQEVGIAPWRRKQVPLLYYGDTLVAAIGLWVDKRFMQQDNLPGLSIW